jgi:hypothetical protein
MEYKGGAKIIGHERYIATYDEAMPESWNSKRSIVK